MSEMTEQLKKQIVEKKVKVKPTNGLSSGSTLVNLAVSGKPNEAWFPGCFYSLVGDSQSGKTWICWQTLAEAANNPLYDNYSLEFYDGERGSRMDVEKFFGKKTADRVKVIPVKMQNEFYFKIDSSFQKGPTIAVLDSMDSLQAPEDQEKFDDAKTAFEKGKETTGTFGMAKAKANSSSLRGANNHLTDHDSILFMISQSRTNVGFGAQFNPKTMSGGNAILFYSTSQVWFAIKGSLKKNVKGLDREIGNILTVKTKKNRETGRKSSVDLIHYFSIGMDNLRGCIDYLITEGHWKGTENKVSASEFNHEGSKEELIKKIEESGTENKLIDLVAGIWDEIEDGCQITRKPRYS